MRWQHVVRAACLAVVVAGGSIATRRLAAQEIDDYEFQVITVKERSFWSSLFDTRAAFERPPFDFLSGGMPERVIYHAGLDITSWSIGAHAVAQWAPAGFDKDGIIVRFFVSEGFERYTDGRRNYNTQITRAHVMPGYLWHYGPFELQVLAGIDGEADLLYIDNYLRKWRSNIGLRGGVDAWWEPTRYVMLASSLAATTIDNGYNGRIAAGWRLYDWFWVGPEAARTNDYFSTQTRIGAHLTGVRTGEFEWSAAAGHVRDNFQREGLYARFGLTMRPMRMPFFEN